MVILTKEVKIKIIAGIIGFILAIAVPLTAYAAVYPNGLGVISKREERMLSSYDKVVVHIEIGDTAWDIQKHLAPHEDVRMLLYYAEIENGVKMGEIHEGDSIIFYKERN